MLLMSTPDIGVFGQTILSSSSFATKQKCRCFLSSAPTVRIPPRRGRSTMPEPKNYSFAHTEIAEILIKQANIHEGHWGVYFEFGLAAANVPTTPDGKTFAPA